MPRIPRQLLAGLAVALLVRAADTDPDVLLRQAEALLESGDRQEALVFLGTALRQLRQARFASKDPLVLARLGRLLDQNGRPAEALELYRNALDQLQLAVRRDPANEDHYLDLADFLEKQNAADSVVLVLEAASKAIPRSVKLRSALGAAYVLRGQTDRAEEVLQRVLAEEPGYEVGYKLLGECYERSQEWDKLAAMAARLKKLNERNAYGWYYESSAAYHLLAVMPGGSLGVIRRSVETAIQLDGGDWRSHVLRGRVLLDLRENGQAAAAFQEAARLDPDVPSTHYLLASTLKRLGRTEESRRALDAFQESQARQKARQSRRLLIEARRHP